MEWVLSAKVGDRVECIEAWIGSAAELIRAAGINQPEVGRVYTIDEVGFRANEPCAFIRLSEFPIAHHPNYLPAQPRFGCVHFRPIQTRQTDISVFTDVLKKASNPIKETA